MARETVLVPKDRLFAWHSVTKGLVMFPGMEAKVGKEAYRDLCQAVLDLEDAIGIIKGDQGFNG